MKTSRSYYFRGLMSGLFICLAYKAFAVGAFISAMAALAVVAIISNEALREGSDA